MYSDLFSLPCVHACTVCTACLNCTCISICISTCIHFVTCVHLMYFSQRTHTTLTTHTSAQHTPCITVVCPSLVSHPSYTHISTRRNRPGTVVTFTCDLGYTLVGGPNVTCLGDGTWSSSIPQCQESESDGVGVVVEVKSSVLSFTVHFLRNNLYQDINK